MAAGLAETNNMKTGIYSLRLGFVAYIIPFFFIFNPALVGIGSKIDILYTLVMSALGIVLISGGAEGYLFFVKRIKMFSRGFFVLLGLLFFIPVKWVNLIGLVVSSVVLGVTFFKKNEQSFFNFADRKKSIEQEILLVHQRLKYFLFSSAGRGW